MAFGQPASPQNAFLLSGGLKLVIKEVATVAASDEVDSGLEHVVFAMAQLRSTPVLTCAFATADQSSVAGNVLLKTWKFTASGDCTPIAASTFSKLATLFIIGY